MLQEAEEFLKNQITNNKELEENINHLERKVAMAREEQRGLLETIDTYETEVNI